MPTIGSTKRTNSSRLNQRQATASKKTTSLHPKQQHHHHHQEEEEEQHSPRQAQQLQFSRAFQASIIGIFYLLTGGSCCALFGMGIASSLTRGTKRPGAVSTNLSSLAGVTTTTEDCFPKTMTNMDSPQTRKYLENRLKGALWGFFAGDALASPTHWFYGGARQVVAEYGHPIDDYTQPHKHLGGSILNKSDPNGGGRAKGFGGSKSAKMTIIGDIINHGKLSYWAPNQSYHYHATLQKGENTLEASLARVLMKSIVATNGGFDPDHFRNAYIEFMQTKGSHNDTYASTCHRMFFANLIFNKLPPKDCPDNDSHNVDTMDGLVLPTIAALAGLKHPENKDGVAKSSGACAGVTRKSKVLEDYAGLWSEVVLGAFGTDDACFTKSLTSFAKKVIRRSPNPSVNDSSTMSACYLGSSLPGLIDMVAKYAAPQQSGGIHSGSGEAVWKALLSNANVGGENVHRASIMGAILGARAGYDALPAKLVDGLYAKAELQNEIEAFVNAILARSNQNSSPKV